MQAATQDKDATLNYWLDMSSALGDRTITAVDSTLYSGLSGITVTYMGINTAAVTDNDGNTIAIGKVVGIQVTGGTSGEAYEILTRMTLDSAEQDDRTLLLRVVDK